MTILTERKVWKRAPVEREIRILGLTAEEQDNVRAAMRVLRIRHGSWAALAKALGMSFKTLKLAVSKRGYRRPTPGLALHVARLAGVPMEDVISGAFPKPGACPMCGRGED